VGDAVKSLGAKIEGLLLLGTGLIMGLYVFGGVYWYFMNPKFQWVTGTAAFLLTAMGAFRFFQGRIPYEPWRTAAFVFLVPVMLHAEAGLDFEPPKTNRSLEVTNISPDDEVPDVPGFVPITLPELFLHSQAEEPAAFLDGSVVLRGEVARLDELDKQNEFVLTRLFIYCCLADSLRVGFRVLQGEDFKVEPGDWVVLYGKLVPAPPLSDEVGEIVLPGVGMTAVNEEFILLPERMEATNAPDIPFVFELKRDPPFNY
jgi:hypothetical protein